ncbi:MAG: sigma-70 family RNA polymerase sigma factor [Acetobacteraceae bacterium]|nr:sigma-70 family RNA polymerase sigma factor [Acetobacteraceae bacterium]
MPATEADPPGEDDAALLNRCARGDRDAFRALYDRWAPRLHGAALRITRQPALAADATHDAFVQIWQQAGRFEPARGSAEAWLVSIGRYRALDLVRRAAREVPGYEPEDQPDDAPDALAALTGTRQADELRRCLGELDADRRRMVVRAFVEGLSHSELAAATRTPIGTVKSVIRRSLALLRRCLEP